jgi:translation initiation factor 2 beta subunit (eIF-2beta)/eIF-5
VTDDLDRIIEREAEERALLNMCVACGAREGKPCTGATTCPSRGA